MGKEKQMSVPQLEIYRYRPHQRFSINVPVWTILRRVNDNVILSRDDVALAPSMEHETVPSQFRPP